MLFLQAPAVSATTCHEPMSGHETSWGSYFGNDLLLDAGKFDRGNVEMRDPEDEADPLRWTE